MAKHEIMNLKEITNGIVNGLKEIDVNGKKSIMYTDTYAVGNTIVNFSIANPTTARWASVLKVADGLEYAVGLKKAYACYYLKEHFEEYKGEQFTSFGKCIDTLFPSISAKTAEEYALVGQYFLKCDNPDESMDVYYAHELLNGASVTNMKQCLSFIDKDSENPLHNILDYIVEGKLNITGTLSTVKKDKEDINADLGKGKKRSKVDSKSKGKKSEDDEITIATVIKFMSDYAETHETKKVEIVSIIEKIESIFNEQ